jgi:hypothetical protein
MFDSDELGVRAVTREVENAMTLHDEQRAFEQQLDELLKEHRGQYVLFKGGQPVDFFSDNDSAYTAALDRFGIDATYLIARVEKSEPMAISMAWDAGVMFGQ